MLRSGEILGVAGISGSGQKELLDVIAGLRSYKAGGEIVFHNPKKEKPVTFFHHSIKKIRKMSAQGFFHDKSLGRSRQIGAKQMPAIAQSLDYRIDTGIVFIGLVRNVCHVV